MGCISIYCYYFIYVSVFMIHTIAMILVIVGALNWGLVGITNLLGNRFDLVEYIAIYLLNVPVLADIIYILVGVSALLVALMRR